LIRLDSNENPYPPPREVMSVISEPEIELLLPCPPNPVFDDDVAFTATKFPTIVFFFIISFLIFVEDIIS
jgi:hypothetical protein